ncbi:hypothetical protein NE237_019479 [Protea cynaroides]|uniref:Uncharacterized protein n=1 Tax=Protea cynaroides TaxID=273540 RepID=A0A9Q0GL13_9MAGN|nr:hypothetical protein NE237_019479 [Protea cynaroides]
MNPSVVQAAIVEPRSDLGRWEDVEDECAEEHENVVTRNVMDFVIGDGLPNQSTNEENNVVPLENPIGAYEHQPVVPTPRIDLNEVPNEGGMKNLTDSISEVGKEGTAIIISTYAGRSLVSTSPGRVETAYDDVLAIDGCLTEQERDFTTVESCCKIAYLLIVLMQSAVLQ